MKLSKTFAAAALGLAAVLGLAGCGPSNDAAMDHGASAATNSTVASYSIKDGLCVRIFAR